MTTEEAIALLEKEQPKTEVYVVRVGKSHSEMWSPVAGTTVRLRSPDIWRRAIGITRCDGRVAFIQEDESQLALADR